MRRHRLLCPKCGARDSKITHDISSPMKNVVIGKPKATCEKCGADIPLYKDEHGEYHPVRVQH